MTTRETELLTANAALELEVVRLKEVLSKVKEAKRLPSYEEIDLWLAEGSPESFTRVTSLDVMMALRFFNCGILGMTTEIQDALSSPFIPTAITKLIEKVENRTIERCAEKLLSIGALGDGDFLAAIRALPNVTLEELL